MSYKTINVKKETYDRLRLYKVAGKTYDDVIQDLIARVDPEELFAEEIKVHRKRLEQMRKGKYATLEDLERDLGNLDRKRSAKA